MRDQIKYRAGYKYQVAETYAVKVAIKAETEIITYFIDLHTDGTLRIKTGYAWDGPSGPAYDSKNTMRGSLVHDALYQLMRRELLPLSYKEQADLEMWRIMREDGMSRLRAWGFWKSVSVGGKSSTLPENKKEILVAP